MTSCTRLVPTSSQCPCGSFLLCTHRNHRTARQETAEQPKWLQGCPVRSQLMQDFGSDTNYIHDNNDTDYLYTQPVIQTVSQHLIAVCCIIEQQRHVFIQNYSIY